MQMQHDDAATGNQGSSRSPLARLFDAWFGRRDPEAALFEEPFRDSDFAPDSGYLGRPFGDH